MKKSILAACVLLLAGSLFIGCKFNTEVNHYFKVKSDPQGIKITISKNVIFQEAGGSTISVEGCPLKIGNLHANKTKKEYIFPFTEKGKTYTVRLAANLSTNGGKSYRWVDLTEKCKAGGGTDYKKYIDLDPILNAKLDLTYTEKYMGGYNFKGALTFGGTSIIKDKSKVFVRIPVEVILGETDWSNTKWFNYAATFENTDILNLTSPSLSFNTDFFTNEVSDFDWNKYDHKYAAYASPLFIFTEFNGIQFETERIFTESKTFSR